MFAKIYFDGRINIKRWRYFLLIFYYNNVLYDGNLILINFQEQNSHTELNFLHKIVEGEEWNNSLPYIFWFNN